MTVAGLVWAGLFRRKVRTILTMLSLVIAFLLYGVLKGVDLGFGSSAKASLNVERLFIHNEVNSRAGLPIAYFPRIEAVPGVRAATHMSASPAYFQNDQGRFSMFATDPEQLFAVLPKLTIAPAEREAMLKTRTGVIVNQELATRFGWEVGDRIPVMSPLWMKKDGSNTWEFDIVGIFDASVYEAAGFFSFYLHYAYLDEARAFGGGTVTFYYADIDDARSAASIGHAIDAMFTNSGAQTKSLSEQAWSQARVNQLGDIGAIANSIIGAVLFTLLFLTSNTMMQSVRERIPEFAVLKAVGFTDAKVIMLVVLEGLLLCVFSAAVGLALAKLVFGAMPNLLGLLSLSIGVILGGLGIAVALAIVSTVAPAWRTSRVSVVDALAGR